MRDIVERLREEVENWGGLDGPHTTGLCKEAADEIDRLNVLLAEAKAINEELRAYWKASDDQAEKLRLALHRTLADRGAAG